MIDFLAGVLLGFIAGGIAAYVAFTGVTKRMARAILEGDE